MDKIKSAMLFSGQGAFFEGMGKSLYEKSVAAHDIMDKLVAVDKNIKSMCFDSSLKELENTVVQQPCLFSIGLMSAASYVESGGLFSAIAGFSLGEITALVFAGAFSIRDGLNLVKIRAQAMQECATKNKGKMVAVFSDINTINNCIKDIKNVYAVNYNCKNQIVISGLSANIDEAIEKLKQNKIRCVELKTSGPFHTPFMKEAGDALLDFLKTIEVTPPNIQVYSCVDANVYSSDVFEIKNTIVKQVQSPVYFENIINNLHERNINNFVEVGVSNVLSNLVKKILKDAKVVTYSETMTA